MMQRLMWMIGASALALLGCGGANESGVGGKAATPTPATFAEQVTMGQAAYGEHCAHCHGDAGQGTDKAPRVVGLDQGALARFKTVGEVATYVVKNMPGDAPGSLDAETYLAILAFDLKANGITLEQKLTLELAATLAVPHAK